MSDRAPDFQPDTADEPHRHWTGEDVHALPVDPDVEPEDRVPRALLERRRHPFVRLLAERRDVLAVIALGGALGALARWGTSVAWPGRSGAFPWATLQVNALGAFLIGVLMVMVRSRGHEGRLLRPFVGVGVLGGYTTFSTYSLDIQQLVLDHRPGAAGAYLVGSVALGLLGAWLGVLTAGALVRAGEAAS
jgi:CrcB protein